MIRRKQLPPEFYAKYARVIGVVMIVIGCILGYFFIYLPAEAAKNHAAQITIMDRMIGLSIVFVVIGFVLLLFNDRFLVLMRNRHQPEYRKKYYLAVIPFVILGMITFYLVTSYLEGLGYVEDKGVTSRENSPL